MMQKVSVKFHGRTWLLFLFYFSSYPSQDIVSHPTFHITVELFLFVKLYRHSTPALIKVRLSFHLHRALSSKLRLERKLPVNTVNYVINRSSNRDQSANKVAESISIAQESSCIRFQCQFLHCFHSIILKMNINESLRKKILQFCKFAIEIQVRQKRVRRKRLQRLFSHSCERLLDFIHVLYLDIYLGQGGLDMTAKCLSSFQNRKVRIKRNYPDGDALGILL